MSGKYRFLLIVQIVLTAIGAALAIHTFVDTMTGEKTILGVLFAVSYLASFVALSLYACVAYKNPSDFPFQLVVYAYAALLGIQILQNGQFLSGPDLGEGLVLFINVANLVAFANVIKFADKLSERKLAIAYLVMSVLLKSAAELVLIVVFIDQVGVLQVLKALSVPILGVTLLVAYLSRLERAGASSGSLNQGA